MKMPPPSRLKRDHIVRHLAEYFPGVSKSKRKYMVDSIFEVMFYLLSCGQSITISNFGTFNVQYRKPRTVRNIAEGTSSKTPVTRAVSFKATPALKAKLNERWVSQVELPE